jgi:glycosyltransferase involved in cell wall biosynthesis
MKSGLGSLLISKVKLLFRDPGYVLSSAWFEVQKALDRSGILKIKKYDLVIIDEVFPFEASLFRYNEFNSYYALFDKVKVYTTGLSLSLLSEHDTMRRLIRDYKARYPGREVAIFNPHRRVSARLAYCLFLKNTFLLLDYFEENELPFAFCFYPGGGFSLSGQESETMLRKIAASPMFKKMIVTQVVTKNYLLDRKICTEDKICFIYGVVSSGSDPAFHIENKKYFGKGKDRLDICFVANRYTARGVDKGFDLFEAAAARMLAEGMNVHFHVVGTFSDSDLADPRCFGKVRFYGTLKTGELKTFFDGMDIILSPNRIDTLLKGAFDGFPTGSVIEAGLRGVLMMASDELGQNICYKDGEDILIIPNDADRIFDRLKSLYNDPAALRRIAVKGFEITNQLFSDQYQMGKRKSFLEPLIAEGHSL